MQPINAGNGYADTPAFKNPSIITGGEHGPDLLFVTPDQLSLYIIELTVGYKTHLHKNVERMEEKYINLIREQSNHFYSVKCINLSMSCLGVFVECLSMLDMLNKL